MSKQKPKRSTTGPAASIHGVPKSLKVEFVIPDNPPAGIYANQMLVQSDGRAAYLTFFQTQPPVLLGDPDDVKKKLQELTALKAHMVAQLIIPQERMEAFLAVLNAGFASGPSDSPTQDKEQ